MTARNWPEILIEAFCLGTFMVSAGVFGTLLEYPGSPLHAALPDATIRRAIMGTLMGLTAVALIYSPWGRRSGAHMNPATTITFVRLGRIAPHVAAAYIAAQLAGGTAGVVVVHALFGPAFGDRPVAYVATVPGAGGEAVAFAAELAISFGMMTVVLWTSNHARWSRYTGLLAGLLVAAAITWEAPLSGMSMNPARTLASAIPGGIWDSLWIYLVAPPLGMLAAAEAFVRVRGARAVHCAKLCHHGARRCIFRCDWHTLVPALLAIVLASTAVHAGQHVRGNVEAVDRIAITVADARRSAAFFRDVLGFSVISEESVAGSTWLPGAAGLAGAQLRIVHLRLGSELVDLVDWLEPESRPLPEASKSNDLWFQHLAIVVRDMDAAHARLAAAGVRAISAGPQTLPLSNPDAAGIEAFYFEDPDGHALELIHFPPGKGDARWRQSGDDLFLGIDHTAIAVSDTEASLGFYVDGLGLHVAGRSINVGIEQERLSGVAGAHVRITSLRAKRGPGVEFLEYLAPQGGRARPADAKPGDLAAWWIVLDAGAQRPVLLLADPDGHLLRAGGSASQQQQSADRHRDPE